MRPVELPAMPSGEMQVASHLVELLDWHQSGAAEAGLGAGTEASWARRAIEVDFSASEVGSPEAGSSSPQGDVPLASVLEFVPSWQPPPEQEEGMATPTEEQQVEAVRAPDSTPVENSQGDQLVVQLQDALAALRQATTRGELGKALLSYCQGRFSRGFLLGEAFGVARVGRAYGPGSDRPEVAALRVDLEAPSLLATAARDGRPIVSSTPGSQEDESLFAALGESYSHLVAAPIRLSQRAVGFIVIDGGPSAFGTGELEELEQLLAVASEAYGRLHDAVS